MASSAVTEKQTRANAYAVIPALIVNQRGIVSMINVLPVNRAPMRNAKAINPYVPSEATVQEPIIAFIVIVTPPANDRGVPQMRYVPSFAKMSRQFVLLVIPLPVRDVRRWA